MTDEFVNQPTDAPPGNAPLVAPVDAPEPPITIGPLDPSTIAHVYQLLVDAEERMSVNAMSTAGEFVTKARQLLAGE